MAIWWINICLVNAICWCQLAFLFFSTKEMTGQVLVSVRLQLWSRYSMRWRPSHKALCSPQWGMDQHYFITSLALNPDSFFLVSQRKCGLWPVESALSGSWQSKIHGLTLDTESESLGWSPRISGFRILLGESHHTWKSFRSSCVL